MNYTALNRSILEKYPEISQLHSPHWTSHCWRFQQLIVLSVVWLFIHDMYQRDRYGGVRLYNQPVTTDHNTIAKGVCCTPIIDLPANYHLLWILDTEITALYTLFLPPLLYNIPEINTKLSFATTLIPPHWFMFRFVHINHVGDCAYDKIAKHLTLNEILITFITTLP